MDYEKKYKEAPENARQEYNTTENVERKQWLEELFPELIESEDEKIRKEIIALVKSQKEQQCHRDGAIYDRMIAWLEKQGKDKPVDTGNKVEPKFHEGDWVVQESIGVYKVVEVCESWYEVIDFEDKHYSISFDKEYMCRLWTIQDAKDGDVLYSLDSNQPFIYKERKPNEQATAYCGLNIYGKFFVWGIKDCFITLNNYVPATKEQRDILMRAMADAGFTFDFEKKELKKIEQKSAWSEEDEKILNSLIISLARIGASTRTDSTSINYTFSKEIEWLKSLKGRMKGE